MAGLLRETDKSAGAAWHLLTVAAFACAQPLFAVLSENAAFFAIKRLTGLDILLFTFAWLILLPGACSLLVLGAKRLSLRLARWLHSLFFFAFTAIAILGALKHTPLQGTYLTIGLSLICACAISWAYMRSANLRSFVGILGFSLIAFPVSLLASRDIRVMLLPEQQIAGLGDNIQKTPVVLLIFDELSTIALMNERGEIDRSRYPGFAELADASTWYRNATTQNSWTENAVPVILTGQKPIGEGRPPVLAQYPQNIFTLLSGSHDIFGYEQLTYLCPDALCGDEVPRPSFAERFSSSLIDSAIVYLHIISPEKLAEALPSIDGAWGDFLDKPGKSKKKSKKKKASGKLSPRGKGKLTKGQWADDEWLFEHFLGAIRPKAGAELHAVHLTFPHVAYRYLPSGKKYLHNMERDNHAGYRKVWENDNWAAIQAQQRYMLQLGFADRMISRLIAHLKETGLFDKTILAVTADHGVAFVPGEHSRRVSRKNTPNILMVPMFFKAPGVPGGSISDQNAMTTDIVPTILSLLSITPPQALDGISLLDASANQRSEKDYFTRRGGDNTRMVFPSQINYQDALHSKISIFGSGNGTDGLYQITPESRRLPRSLIGKSVADLRGFAPMNARINRSKQLSAVNLPGRFLPALIGGEARPHKGAAAPVYMAVALNGVVRALTVGNSINKHGLTNFSVMLPEDGFVNGDNKVEVFELLERN